MTSSPVVCDSPGAVASREHLPREIHHAKVEIAEVEFRERAGSGGEVVRTLVVLRDELDAKRGAGLFQILIESAPGRLLQ